MTDATELDSAQGTKVAGTNPDGTEQGWIESGIKATGERGLHVIAESSLTSNLRVDTSFIPITLNGVNGVFTTLYSYNGSGSFLGFDAEFSQDTVQIQLQVDGQQVFSEDGNPWVDLANIKTFANKEVLNGSIDFSSGFDFAPIGPIRYTTNITILARSSTGASNRTMQRIIVKLSKEA